MGFHGASLLSHINNAKQIYAYNLGGNDPDYQSIEEAMRFYQVCNELWNSIASKLHNNKTINFPNTIEGKDNLIYWVAGFLYKVACLPDDGKYWLKIKKQVL